MRSLFCKLFASFLFISLLASVTTVIISYWAQVGPYGELKKRVVRNQVLSLSHSLSITGLAASRIQDIGGRKALIRYLRKVEEQHQHNLILLLQEDGSSVSGRSLPTGAAELAVASLRSKEMQYNISGTEIVVAVPLMVKGRQPTIVVGSTERILRPHVFFDGGKQRGGAKIFFIGHRFGLPFLVVICIGAAGCYLLARSLASPIRDLQKASQQMSNGDFSARVQIPGRRKDEIADLSHDFNTMAERTQSLILSQKRLIRDVSHELRSPLTRQNLAIELAKQRFSDAEPYLLRIEKESVRLGELIDQLLVLTRLEGSGEGILKENVPLHELLAAIVHDAEFEASARNRIIRVEEMAKVTIVASKEMLGRALENVIRNGLRYTESESAVEIRLFRNRGSVVISVLDHGPGVPSEDLEKIFVPFFRVARSRDRDSGGTGIGLAIARQAVLLHGGSIQAKNISNAGLLIEIQIPMV